MTHDTGIHVVIHGNAMGPGLWIASCNICDFESKGYRSPKNAQRAAIEHQGGTYSVREREPKPQPMHMEEMFPGAK